MSSRSRRRWLLGATLSVAAIALVQLVDPAVAWALNPGICKCNSGCHASPGQCVIGNGCNIGYEPLCGYRGGDGGGLASCPKVSYISCDGTCDCAPIPGFCDLVGGADYCETGPEAGVDATSDTTVSTTDTAVADIADTTLSDTTGADTTAMDTTATAADTTSDTAADGPNADSATSVDVAVSDTTPPLDATPVGDAVTVDGAVDALVSADVGDAQPGDACDPLVCQIGTISIPVPGSCDPFCAQPCGGGEFKCFSGTTCSGGYCVPNCLLTPCVPCQRCSLGDGTCFDDPSACGSDGGSLDGGSGDGLGADGAGRDGAGLDSAGLDSAGLDGAMSGDATLDDGAASSDGTDANAGNNGGCGCAIPGTGNAGASSAGLAALMLIGATLRRRRRER